MILIATAAVVMAATAKKTFKLSTKISQLAAPVVPSMHIPWISHAIRISWILKWKYDQDFAHNTSQTVRINIIQPNVCDIWFGNLIYIELKHINVSVFMLFYFYWLFDIDCTLHPLKLASFTLFILKTKKEHNRLLVELVRFHAIYMFDRMNKKP